MINKIPKQSIIFKMEQSDRTVQNALAYNYRKGFYWEIGIHLYKIHKNCFPKTIAKKINNLFLQEFICSILRENDIEEKPPCESLSSAHYRCPCKFPLLEGMILK